MTQTPQGWAEHSSWRGEWVSHLHVYHPGNYLRFLLLATHICVNQKGENQIGNLSESLLYAAEFWVAKAVVNPG